MQLKLKRSERKGGMFGHKTFYIIDFRAEFTDEERAYVNSHDLGGLELYSLMGKGVNVYVTVKSLTQGHHYESQDINTIAEIENDVVDACKAFKERIEHGGTHDGREAVIDI